MGRCGHGTRNRCGPGVWMTDDAKRVLTGVDGPLRDTAILSREGLYEACSKSCLVVG